MIVSVMYAYFMCRVVCTCIHESDNLHVFCCCLLLFFTYVMLQAFIRFILTSNVHDALVCVYVCVCVCVCVCDISCADLCAHVFMNPMQS